jgi:ribosome-associated translation inhibitor RaiA
VLVLALGAIVSLLLTGNRSFELPNKHQPPSSAKRIQRPPIRNNLKNTLELPLEEPPEPEAEKEQLPAKRTPYALNIYTHTPTGNNGLNAAHREYILDKVKAALENTQDWIERVDVRVSIDYNWHKGKVVSGEEVYVAEDGKESAYNDRETKKRELAPFMVEASVYLDGGVVVLSASPKHAQATLTEAVDHMYDFLRRQLRKEKERRIDARRKQKSGEASEVISAYTDQVDDELMALNDEAEARMDAEAERLYSLTEK